MLHLISKNDASKKFRFGKKYALGLACIVLVLLSLLTYTVVFMRDTSSVERCLAYPYANASKLEKIENKTAAGNHCVAYLSTQNDDGIQEMYLLKNKRWLNLFDVQRYFVLEHNASVLEEVGFFSTRAPSDVKKESMDWYFYSQNDLQIEKMVCTFNTSGGAQVTQEFFCNANEPFIYCIPEMQEDLRLESMTGYSANGAQVYTFNTGLFESV